MRILDSKYPHRRSLPPVQASISLSRYRVIGWFNDQSIRVVKIKRELSFAIAHKLVTSRLWQMRQVFQYARSAKIVETTTHE